MEVVIFDIEASCEDKTIRKNYNMETIEIGAVKVKDGEIVDTFNTFVKPEYVESLTPFCTNLTGITDEDLKDAPSFTEAIVEFYEFIYGLPIYSCGEFDRKFLSRELKEKGTSYIHNLAYNAINSNHRNLKILFNKVVNKKMGGMLSMAKELNIDVEGNHHRALDDSMNLAKIYIELENLRETKLMKEFKDKMPEIVDAINANHSRNFKIENDKIVEWEETKTFPEFLDYWAYVIFADHSKHKDKKESYLSISELNKLELLKSMDALETRYKASF